MPTYFKIGDKYFTGSEQGSFLENISEQDVIGRRGTIPTGTNALDLIRREGDLTDVDPSQVTLRPKWQLFTEPGAKDYEGALADWQSQGSPYQAMANGKSLGFVQNQAQAEALGITAPQLAPGGTVGTNQVFNQYLQQTGQTYQGGQFSGSSSVPNQNSQPGQYDATIGQGGQTPNQVGGQFGNRTFGRVGDQVFETTGGQRRPITSKEFEEKLKAQGLNLEVLPQLGTASTTGQQEAENNFGAGIVGTGMYQNEQTDFFKDIKNRMANADKLQAEILASMERSDEEKSLKKNVNDITSSFEMGLTDIQGQTIPMTLITGQGAQLERQANDKLRALNRTLETFQDDREEKFKILSKAYDMGRGNVNDAIAFYNLTKPEKLAFDSETGTVFMQNPMTGEVYQSKVEGFQGNASFVKDLMQKYPDAGILPTDSYSSAAQKLNSSKIYQQQTRLADTGSTEADKTKEKEEKRDQEFNKALSSWDWTANANREQFIRQLQASYPEYTPSQISAAVYKIYPDGFNKLK